MNKIKIYFTVFTTILLLTRCGTVEETLYLREAEVTGPIAPAPVHIVDSVETPAIVISPTFSYNTRKSMTGEISQYTTLFELDSSFVPSETSLTWTFANITSGIDFDFLISRNFAISFGANYSVKENFNAWGGNFGIGLFSYKDGTALRFDAGLKITTMNYDAYTVSHIRYTDIFGGNEEYIVFYHDIGSSTHFDPYFNLTFNTAFKNWPVNFFINGGYVIQTLFSFEPSTSYYFMGTYTQSDRRGSSTAGFINLTPGVYFNFGESSRVLIGSRIYIETQIDEADPNYFIMPMIQVDFTL